MTLGRVMYGLAFLSLNLSAFLALMVLPAVGIDTWIASVVAIFLVGMGAFVIYPAVNQTRQKKE